MQFTLCWCQETLQLPAKWNSIWCENLNSHQSFLIKDYLAGSEIVYACQLPKPSGSVHERNAESGATKDRIQQLSATLVCNTSTHFCVCWCPSSARPFASTVMSIPQASASGKVKKTTKIPWNVKFDNSIYILENYIQYETEHWLPLTGCHKYKLSSIIIVSYNTTESAALALKRKL